MTRVGRKSSALALAFVSLWLPCAVAEDSEKVSGLMLQSMLSHPFMMQYLHLDLPARSPVLVSDNLLKTPTELGHQVVPIEVVTDSAGRHDSTFRIDKVEIDQAKMTVSVSYPIEGVIGKFSFDQTIYGEWILTSANVSEH